jgi:hypothetical protein
MLDDLMKMLDVQFNPDTYRVKGKKDEHTKPDTSSDSEQPDDVQEERT